MSRPGDWNCSSCQHLNFSWRDMCQRCGEARSGEGGEYCNFGGPFTCEVLLPGDWYCSASNCGVHNYAKRPSCFKCGKYRDGSAALHDVVLPSPRSGPVGSSGWKPGDWICLRPGCSEHNFAVRTECFMMQCPEGLWQQLLDLCLLAVKSRKRKAWREHLV